jgi:hypothetical protein
MSLLELRLSAEGARVKVGGKPFALGYDGGQVAHQTLDASFAHPTLSESFNTLFGMSETFVQFVCILCNCVIIIYVEWPRCLRLLPV